MNIVFLRRLQKQIFILSLTFAATFCALAQANQTPSFEAVYKLLQENVTGLSSEELNAAVLRGLLSELEGQVSLVTNAAAEVSAGSNLVSKTAIFEKSFAYLRIARIESGLSEKIAEQYKQLTGTNKFKGVILDLRFAAGDDYSAAAKTADLFISTEQPLIHWGENSLSASAKTMAISVPCAILINSRTRGAAEALAAALRETRVGLLIGANTAGQASVFKEFPFADGQVLRIASSPVKVGKNKVLDANGLKPDIQLEISLANERAYLQDPYQIISRPVDQVSLTLNTNETPSIEPNRPRINEAELVRRKREGLSTDEEFLDQQPGNAVEIRVIRDPALARALDLLKGLALIKANRGI
ncbi:MAG: hypothetical protein H0X66_01525 [Verrucomicrobia bacterium]|nr:hypothetical protein [Verrucomicrobiota bacterium]